MTIVLVHGVPETADVWQLLLAELRRDDVVRLSPPGFGAPVPAGFTATMDEYRDWLIGELEAMDQPVDLVGHDWGGGHVVNAALLRPDLLRSWVSDTLGAYEPDYVWYDLARTWQTPGAGERQLAEFLGGTDEQKIGRLGAVGIEPATARAMAPWQNDDMRWAIVRLYRSAVQPIMARRGRDLPLLARRPGLHVLASGDHFVGSAEMRRRAAQRAGARLAVLDGPGHWWMLEDPATAARTLTGFWASVVN